VPSPLEPLTGAAQPKPNVRKTLDTTSADDLALVVYANGYGAFLRTGPGEGIVKRDEFAVAALNKFRACNPYNEGLPYTFYHRRYSMNYIGRECNHGASLKLNSFSVRFISKIYLKLPSLKI